MHIHEGLEQRRIQHRIGANVDKVQALVDWIQEGQFHHSILHLGWGLSSHRTQRYTIMYSPWGGTRMLVYHCAIVWLPSLCFLRIIDYWKLPGNPMVLLSLLGPGVQSPVGKLRSHKPHGTAKKEKGKQKDHRCFKGKHGGQAETTKWQAERASLESRKSFPVFFPGALWPICLQSQPITFSKAEPPFSFSKTVWISDT